MAQRRGDGQVQSEAGRGFGLVWRGDACLWGEIGRGALDGVEKL